MSKRALRIALTGARGRLAPGLARYLAARGHVVQTFSRSAGVGHRSVAELCSSENLAVFDDVLHLGWSSVPLVSERNPGIEEEHDLPLARAITQAAAACSTPPRLVFFSTAAVYGNTGESPVDEMHVCRPLGRYAEAKLAAEKILLGAPRASVLRITNVFGAGCTQTRPQGIIPVLADAARSGKTVSIWGDGQATKDYLCVDDLHRAVDAVLQSDACGVFNVASGHVLSVNDLVRLVSKAAGTAVLIQHAPHFDWDVEQSHISSQRLCSSTGWMPEVDPEAAVVSMMLE